MVVRWPNLSGHDRSENGNARGTHRKAHMDVSSKNERNDCASVNRAAKKEEETARIMSIFQNA
jgi:hypothetical protein